MEHPIHPVYGGAIVPGFRPIPGFDGYEINEYCVVRGKWGKELSPSSIYHVGLWANGKRKSMYVYRLGLMTFYPDITAHETADHIDNNHHNHYIGNLQWATRPDNSSKSHAGVPSKSGPAQSKPVWLLNGREGDRVRRYTSTVEAAASLGIIHVGGVARSAGSGGHIAIQGFFFEYDDQPDLPGEEWRTSATLDRVLQQEHKPDHKKVKVSSHGRVRTWSGIKTRGSINVLGGDSKVRHIGVNGRKFMVHQLVFMGWRDIEAPARDAVDVDGNWIVICHNDYAPLDEMGKYRNWPIDLSLGTQKQNMLDSHEARRTKRAREEEGDDGDENYDNDYTSMTSPIVHNIHITTTHSENRSNINSSPQQ